MNEHVFADGSMAVCALPGLSVHIYRRRGTIEHARILHDHLHDPLLGPRFLQVLLVVPDSVKDIPDDGYRAAAARNIHDVEPSVVAGIVVVARDGFLGATARAIITGLHWATRAGEKQKTFASLDEGAAWLAAQAPELDVSAATIVDATNALHKKLSG